MTVTEQLGEFDRILTQGDINSLFQPIVSLSDGSIYGYEALSRGPSNSPLHSPMALFAIAARSGRLSELEIACRHNACRRFSEQQLGARLFLNVSPDSLLEATHQPGRTLAMLDAFGIAPERVVIELTEQAPFDDFQLFGKALHHYRSMGFSIALDDLGAGYSSLRVWSELRPDYVKIDRHFIDGIHHDTVKREFVGSILKMAQASHAHVVAEGIELEQELAVLADMGVELLQGYLICRPQEHPPTHIRQLPYSPTTYASPARQAPERGLNRLLIEQPALHAQQSIAQVLEHFHAQPRLNSLAVLNSAQQPLGIVHRNRLPEARLTPLASNRLTKQPISELMHQDFLAVDIEQSLQQVSRLLTHRAEQRIEEDFIITQQGQYLGLGRVIDLLKLITELIPSKP